jgi:hypothetical protein
MSQRTSSLLLSLLLAAPMGAPSAQAACRSPKNICKHIDDCLHSNSSKKDAEQIREGVRTRDGKMVFAGAEACSRDFGKKTAVRQLDARVLARGVSHNCQGRNRERAL